MDIIKHILLGQLAEAKAAISEELDHNARCKLIEVRKMIAARDFALDELAEKYEVIQMDEARFKIVRARIRAGKVQRRKKVASQKGFTIRGGKVTKMSPKERRTRTLAQRKGARKRRGKVVRAKVNTKRALRRRKALGV